MLFKMDLSEMYRPVLFRGKVSFTRTTLKSDSSVCITMIVPIIFLSVEYLQKLQLNLLVLTDDEVALFAG